MEFNQVDCLVDRANTGFGRCVPKFGKLEYTIAIPKGTKITRTQAQDMQTYLNALFINDDPYARGYRLPKWINVTDSTTDSVTEDLGGGVTTKLYDGAVIWVRRTIAGGLCSHFALRNQNGAQEQYDYLECFRSLDKSAKFFITGRKYYNSTTGENELMGFTYDDIDVPNWKIPSGTTGAMITMKTIMGSTEQWNEDLYFAPVSFEIADLATVQNVDLTAVKQATATFDVLAVYGCGGKNLIEAHPGDLDDPDAWKCINNLGNEVDITGVTEVSGKYRIVIDSTTPDADYTAGTHFRFMLRPISITSAAPFDIDYIESNTTLAVAK